MRTVWAMTETMVYLRHLQVREQASCTDDDGVERWRLAA